MSKHILLLDPGEMTKGILLAELQQRGFLVTDCAMLDEVPRSRAPHVLVVNTFYGLDPVKALVSQPGWEQTLVCGLSYSEFAAQQFCDQGLTIFCHQLPLDVGPTVAAIAHLAQECEDILVCTGIRARILEIWRTRTTTLHQQIEAGDQPFFRLGQQSTYEEIAHRLGKLAPIASPEVHTLVQLLQAEVALAELEERDLAARLGDVPTIGHLRLQGKCEAYRAILPDLRAFAQERSLSHL